MRREHRGDGVFPRVRPRLAPTELSPVLFDESADVPAVAKVPGARSRLHIYISLLSLCYVILYYIILY